MEPQKATVVDPVEIHPKNPVRWIFGKNLSRDQILRKVMKVAATISLGLRQDSVVETRRKIVQKVDGKSKFTFAW